MVDTVYHTFIVIPNLFLKDEKTDKNSRIKRFRGFFVEISIVSFSIGEVG